MFRCYCVAWVWQEKKVHKPLDRRSMSYSFRNIPAEKQINALTKNIARVIVFMGLEPLQGATALPLYDEDIPGSNAQRNIEPNHLQQQGYSWMFVLMCSILFLAVLVFCAGFTNELMMHTNALNHFTPMLVSWNLHCILTNNRWHRPRRS